MNTRKPAPSYPLTSPKVLHLNRLMTKNVVVADIIFLACGISLSALALWAHQAGGHNIWVLGIVAVAAIWLLLLAPSLYASFTPLAFRRVRNVRAWGVSHDELALASMRLSLIRAAWVGLCLLPPLWLSQGYGPTLARTPSDGSTTFTFAVGPPTALAEETQRLAGSTTALIAPWWLLVALSIWALVSVATACLCGVTLGVQSQEGNAHKNSWRGWLFGPRLGTWLLTTHLGLWPVAWKSLQHALSQLRTDHALAGTHHV